jgi:molecular chaperone GrpE
MEERMATPPPPGPEENDAPGTPDGTPDGAPSGEARVAQLEAELTAAKAEASANWDKFLRERAEMENYKRRIERTYAEQSRRERKDLLLRFLNVLDNLERALSYQSASGGEADVKALITGLRLTEGQFRDLLTSAGVTEVPAVGEAFDPARHEAVATAETQEAEEGQIVEELQKGYLYGEELLRPARVKVATRA